MEVFKNCFKDISEVEEKVFVIDVVNEVMDFLVKILLLLIECIKLY